MPARVWLDPELRPLPFQEEAEAIEFLETARVIGSTTLSGVTRSQRLRLEKGGIETHAAFKTFDLRKRRARLADGTVLMPFVDSYKSQIASYRISRAVGMRLVPPTTERRIKGMKGAIQLWIEGAMTESDRKEQEIRFGGDPYFEHQVRDLHVIWNLVNDTDLNQGNILWDGTRNLWIVDQSRTLGDNAALPRPDKIEQCSRSLWSGLQGLEEGQLRRELSDYLTRYEIRSVLIRRDKIVGLLRQRIERLGEEQVLFTYGEVR